MDDMAYWENDMASWVNNFIKLFDHTNWMLIKYIMLFYEQKYNVWIYSYGFNRNIGR